MRLGVAVADDDEREGTPGVREPPGRGGHRGRLVGPEWSRRARQPVLVKECVDEGDVVGRGEAAQRKQGPVCRVTVSAAQLASQRGREIALRLALAHAGLCQGLTDPVARVALHAQRRVEVAEHPGCPDGPVDWCQGAHDAPLSLRCGAASALGTALALRTHDPKSTTDRPVRSVRSDGVACWISPSVRAVDKFV